MGTLAGVAGGPGTVTLQLLNVAPGETVPAESAAGPELLVVEAGTVGIRTGSDSPELIRGENGETNAVVRAGTLLTIRNPGEEPAALLRLTLAFAKANDEAQT
jgi:hypothetical protein